MKSGAGLCQAAVRKKHFEKQKLRNVLHLIAGRMIWVVLVWSLQDFSVGGHGWFDRRGVEHPLSEIQGGGGGSVVTVRSHQLPHSCHSIATPVATQLPPNCHCKFLGKWQEHSQEHTRLSVAKRS